MNIQLSLKKLELTNFKNNKLIDIINTRKQNTYYSKIIMDNQQETNNSKLYNNSTTNKKWYMQFL
jgi:hypothetical protein